jgi:glutamine phosphoribosylpyrophosphate amidotransferase
MCEQFIARSDRPFRVDRLFPFAERLERYGIAGFGWGAAWLAAPGQLESYRDVHAFRDDDDGRAAIGAIETTTLLIHLRRPSLLSTLTLADTQPFADPAGRFAFSHNGDLRNYQAQREAFQAAGRIHGRADTEVGARWLEDAWRPDVPVPDLLGSLHRTFEGQANLAALASDGSAYHYAGNLENPVFRFRLDEIEIASTGVYSLDQSLFDLVIPSGEDRRRINPGETAVLG